MVIISFRLFFIENADATPPHLEVFPAVGKLSWIAWFCEVLCDGQLSVFFREGSSVFFFVCLIICFLF